MPLLLPAAPAAAATCESLATLVMPDTTITLAESHAAGPFTPPGSSTSLQLPAFCRVAGFVKPAVRFEAWMPTVNWSGKFQGVGNGGLAGTISYGAMATALNRNSPQPAPIPATRSPIRTESGLSATPS